MIQKLRQTDRSTPSRSEATERTDLQWRFADPDGAEKLKIDQLDWTHPEDLPGAELIKENVQRRVWRVKLDGSTYYVKLYLRRSRWWAIKRTLRGPVSQKEWRVAHYALNKHINCVQPVACAVEKRHAGPLDCLLITRGVPQSLPLTEYWRRLSNSSNHERASAISKLEDALAELLARAHQAGIAHSDLHPGNLLVGLSNGQAKVYLVDLHSVQIDKAVSNRVAVHNLAQLNQWFRQNATLTQRMRLLKRYMRFRSRLGDPTTNGAWLAKTFKHWAQWLDDVAKGHSSRLWASRDRRVMKTCKYFAKIKLHNGWRAHVFLKAKRRTPCSTASALEFNVSAWRNVLLEPEELLKTLLQQSRPIKHSRSALVCRGHLQIGQHNVAVVCKRHIRRKPLAAIWDCLRYSRCLRAWKMGFAMLHRSLPIAQPLAALERRIGPYLADSILITEEVSPSVNLRVFLTTILPALDRQRRREVKRVLIKQLAELLRKMHRNGFVHRDMKATNILVRGVRLDKRDEVDPSILELVLVDLDGLSLKFRPTRREQLRPLVRLSLSADLSADITQTDRARFLRSYLTYYGSGVPDWKAVWREIETERESRFQDHLAG